MFRRLIPKRRHLTYLHSGAFAFPIFLVLTGLLQIKDEPMGVDLKPYTNGEYRSYSRIIYCDRKAPALKIAASAKRYAAGKITQKELEAEVRWVFMWHFCANEPKTYTFVRTIERAGVRLKHTVAGETIETTKDASVYLARLPNRQIVYGITHAIVPPPDR